jgi:hypothetical protein
MESRNRDNKGAQTMDNKNTFIKLSKAHAGNVNEEGRWVAIPGFWMACTEAIHAANTESLWDTLKPSAEAWLAETPKDDAWRQVWERNPEMALSIKTYCE